MRRAVVTIAAGVVLALGFAPLAAYAQIGTTTAPGYPGPAGFDRIQDLGDRRQGDTFTVRNCDFRPGTLVNRTVNGAPAGQLTVGPDGCVTFTVTIAEDGVALGGSPLIAAIGVRSLFAQTARQPTISIDGVNYSASAVGVTTSIVVQGTANDGGSGRWNNVLRIVDPRTGPGPIGRTGTMVLRWSLLGGATLAIGTLLLLSSRRRRLA